MQSKNAMICLLTGWLCLFSIPSDAKVNFEFGSIFGVGLRASTIDNGDLDGDGDLDLAIANIFSDSITIALNDGNGNFKELREVALEGGRKHPVALAIGELDGQGNLDLAVAHVQEIENSANPFMDSNIIFFYAEDDGSYFQFSQSIDGVPSYIDITDLDSDGDNDVIVGNNGEFVFQADLVGQFGAGVYPFINRGRGLFSNADPKLVDGSTIFVHSFDFDNDGKMDVLGLNQGSLGFDANFQITIFDPAFELYKGTDSGLAEAEITILERQPWFMDQADMDSDGLDDIIFTIVGDTELSSFLGTNASVNIFRNTGTRFNPLLSIPMPGIAFSVLADDYDQDGDSDFVVTVEEITDVGGAQRLDPSLRIYENDGNQNFTEVGSFVIPEEPRYATKGDFDGDGDNDIAVLCTILDAARSENAVNGEVYIFFNNNQSHVLNWEMY